MGVKDKVVELFEDNKGEYLSGAEIADRLNVSRSAIWKAVKSMQTEGYEISAVTNKGYCLSADSDVLSAVGIKRYLKPEAAGLDIAVCNSVASTNSLLRERASGGAKEGLTIIAAEQTEGRGRRGRSFYSPADTGVYISVLLRPELTAEKATLITTAAAVAVCEGIEAVTGKATLIKWVNDIFVEGKKVSGILTEASLSMENSGVDYVVLGVGINVYNPQGGFPDDIQTKAGFIMENRQSDARNRIAAEFLNCLMKLYENFAEGDFIKEYKRRSFVIGKKINVLSTEGSAPATAIDIDDNCALMVRYEDGSNALLSSGEISIRVREEANETK